MIKVIHRINNINQLKIINKKFGIEVDVRSYGKEIVVNHDPFIKSLNFSKWINFYDHKILFVNIKEVGIERTVLDILNLNGIKNFVLFDVSFPYLFKFLNLGEKRIATRVSKYESINSTFNLNIKPKWIWIDLFEDKIPLNSENYNKLIKNNYKLILVSPELHGRSDQSIDIIKKQIERNQFKFNAVCTKYPDKW